MTYKETNLKDYSRESQKIRGVQCESFKYSTLIGVENVGMRIFVYKVRKGAWKMNKYIKEIIFIIRDNEI